MSAPNGIGLAAVLLASLAARAEEGVAVSEATKDDSGFLVHEVRSPHFLATPR